MHLLMKYLLFVAGFLFLPLNLFSQNLQIRPAGNGSDLTTNQFPLDGGILTIRGDQFVLGDEAIINPAAWSVSEWGGRAAFLKLRGVVELTSLDANGSAFFEKNLEFFDSGDETLDVYQFGDGRIILRDNVANFTFLNPRGNTAYSLSNSSGSPEGERPSLLASDRYGNTVVLYNPVINRRDGTGSRARVVFGDQDDVVFFSSTSEEITSVRVHNRGFFISLITETGGADMVYLFDRLGNELFSMESDEELIGVSLSENAGHLTLYSSGRVQVYEVPGGRRLGSASSRSSLIFADYDPVSQNIIALGGDHSNLKLNDPEITVVSLSRREIVRENIPFSVSLLDTDRVGISRISSDLYSIHGLNREIELSVSF